MKMLNLLKSRVVKNAGWIVGGRIVHMICAFAVSLLTARYLGPGNYGLINYATAYTTFFYSICTLGINSILVKALIDDEENEGEILGTAIVLQGIASLFSSLMIIGIVKLIDGKEDITVIVTALCTIGLIFRIFEVLRYWFQAHLRSKYTAITTTVAYLLTSVYRIILLVRSADVKWFALAMSVDYLAEAACFYLFYKRNNGSRMHFSKERATKLLKMGAPFILAGLMVSIYGNTDKLMLKQMLNEEAVGYYSTATSLCNVWVFLLTAIIDSMYPVIMETRRKSIHMYKQQNRLLYAIVFYVSVFVSLMFVIFAKPAVHLLYGDVYLPTVGPLRIATWYVAFSYLGVARNAWIVSEGQQKYIAPIYVGAAITNIILNFALIPIWGASGAAAASLLTQITTIFVWPLMIKTMRPNAKLMLDAILLRDIKQNGK